MQVRRRELLARDVREDDSIAERHDGLALHVTRRMEQHAVVPTPAFVNSSTSDLLADAIVSSRQSLTSSTSNPFTGCAMTKTGCRPRGPMGRLCHI